LLKRNSEGDRGAQAFRHGVPEFMVTLPIKRCPAQRGKQPMIASINVRPNSTVPSSLAIAVHRSQEPAASCQAKCVCAFRRKAKRNFMKGAANVTHYQSYSPHP
jgi:hypothetical protein